MSAISSGTPFGSAPPPNATRYASPNLSFQVLPVSIEGVPPDAVLRMPFRSVSCNGTSHGAILVCTGTKLPPFCVTAVSNFRNSLTYTSMKMMVSSWALITQRFSSYEGLLSMKKEKYVCQAFFMRFVLFFPRVSDYLF